MTAGRNVKGLRRATSATVLLTGLGGAVSGPPRGVAAEAGHDFQICKGEYALCAASTCKPTGKSISVNVIAGGTASFPEYECTCPVFEGPAIADLNGGNMQGSCEPPPDQI